MQVDWITAFQPHFSEGFVLMGPGHLPEGMMNVIQVRRVKTAPPVDAIFHQSILNPAVKPYP